MITFFTTTKKFEGHNKNSQLNAINSWLTLHPGVEIIIFEKPVGFEFIPRDSRIKIIDKPESEFGIPRIDYMFDYTSNNAQNKLCCFLNADIILTKKFLTIINKLLLQLKGNFLAVGQRYDFDNTNGEWDFSLDWEQIYLPRELMKIHPPTGSDYFLFPAKQYNKSMMSPLIVGRPGWDLWMIYDARKRGYPTIDLSEVYKVYHQNHDYSHKKQIYKSNLDEPEAQKNLSFLPLNGKFDFTLYACNYVLNENLRIEKSYARGNRFKYLRIELLLGNNKFLSKLKFRFFTKKNYEEGK